MVHAGELKGALKVCRFHTRDPPVKNSGHTSRESAWVRFYLISRGKKHERKKKSIIKTESVCLQSGVEKKLHWHC